MSRALSINVSLASLSVYHTSVMLAVGEIMGGSLFGIAHSPRINYRGISAPAWYAFTLLFFTFHFGRAKGIYFFNIQLHPKSKK